MMGETAAKRAERQGHISSYLKLILVFLALVLPGFFAGRRLASWPVRLRYPGELDSVEGRELAAMVYLREGVPIYAPASPERFDAANYGPLYYLLGSRLIDPQRPVYFPLRVLSVLATLGLAAACGLLAFWLARSRLAAAIASLLFLAYRFVTHFCTAARPDSVALLLGFSGFLVACRFRDTRRVLLAAPLMTLAFYYKQQWVAASLAVLLFLLLEKRFRLAAEFAGLLGLAGLTLLGLFHFLIFPRQAFLLHFVAYNLVPFTLRKSLLDGYHLGILFLIPILVALQFLRARADKLLACYLGCALLPVPLMLAKEGAAMNYYLEPVLIMGPLFAALLAMRIAKPSRAVPLLLLLGIALWLGQLPRWLDSDPRPEDFVQEQAVRAFLRENFRPHTPALSEFAGDLLRAGLDTPISDLYQYTWLVCKGTLSDQDLLAQLRDRRFGVILLAVDLRSEEDAHEPGGLCLTEPLHQAIIQNYRLAASFAFHISGKRHYYAWVPRG